LAAALALTFMFRLSAFGMCGGGCLGRNRSPKPGPDPEPGQPNDGLGERGIVAHPAVWKWGSGGQQAGEGDGVCGRYIGSRGLAVCVAVQRAQEEAAVWNELERILLTSIWTPWSMRVVEDIEEKI